MGDGTPVRPNQVGQNKPVLGEFITADGELRKGPAKEIKADERGARHAETAAPLAGVDEPGGAAAGTPVSPAAGFESGGAAGVQPGGVAESIAPATIDQAAHAAATSPLNDRPEPTEGQKRAGNYTKGHVRVAGLDLSVENPAGSVRSGTDSSGRSWSVTLRDHYGYLKGTRGKDKDHLDVFVKPGTPAEYAGPVFVVDQKKPGNGHFDEHKIMLGYADQAEAEAAYRRNYAVDWDGLRAITPMSMPSFKAWLDQGDTTRPAAPADLIAKPDGSGWATQSGVSHAIRKRALNLGDYQRFQNERGEWLARRVAPESAAPGPVTPEAFTQPEGQERRRPGSGTTTDTAELAGQDDTARLATGSTRILPDASGTGKVKPDEPSQNETQKEAGAEVAGPPRAEALEAKGSDANRDAPDALEDGVRFSRSAMKSVEANLQRGREALAKAVTERTSVHRAMFRTGLGWVDFVWGSVGRVTATGKTRGAMGLAHILDARQRKDGFSDSEALQFLDALVTTLASGSEFSRHELDGTVRVGLEHHDAIAWLVRRPGSNAWVVTGYEKSPDGRMTGRAIHAPTHTATSLTRDDMGAGFESSLRQASNDVNRLITKPDGTGWKIKDGASAEIRRRKLNKAEWEAVQDEDGLWYVRRIGGSAAENVRFSRNADTSPETAGGIPEARDAEGRRRAPNGKPSKLNEGQWKQVRTPAFKAWFGDWEALANATMERAATTLSDAKERAAAFVGKPLDNRATGLSATVSNRTLGKMASESAGKKSTSMAEHALAVANADKLFAGAILDHSHADRDGEPTIRRIHRYVAPMLTASGEVVAVKMTVKERVSEQQPNPLYSIETLEIENPPSALSRANPDGTGIRPQAGFSESVRQALQGVNPDSVSKVLDENGEPRVLYHGTRREFAVFREDTRGRQTGTANAHLGFFFSPSPQEASRYAAGWGTEGGQVMPVFLSIRNPYEMSHREMDDLALAGWRAMQADPAYDPEAVVAFGDRAGQRQAADRMRRYAQFAQEQVAARRAELEAQGYDGIVVRLNGGDEWVAFRGDQIKSATGNTGAFGSRAPTAEEAGRFGMTRDEAREAQAQGDIRFSREADTSPETAGGIPEVRDARGRLLAPNGKPSKLNEGPWQWVRTPEFKRGFGDWEALAHRRFLEGAPVATLNGDEFAPDGVPLTKKVPQWYADNGYSTVSVTGIGDVALDERAVKDSMSHGIGRDKAAAFAAVPDILKSGRIVHSGPMRGESAQGTVYHVVAPIEMGGRAFVADVMVKADENSRRMYVHEVALREKLQQGAFKTEALTTGDSALNGAPAGAIRSVLQSIYSVNPDSVTKLVDENGEPLVLYHGWSAGKARRPVPEGGLTLMPGYGTFLSTSPEVGREYAGDWANNVESSLRAIDLASARYREAIQDKLQSGEWSDLEDGHENGDEPLFDVVYQDIGGNSAYDFVPRTAEEIREHAADEWVGRLLYEYAPNEVYSSGAHVYALFARAFRPLILEGEGRNFDAVTDNRSLARALANLGLPEQDEVHHIHTDVDSIVAFMNEHYEGQFDAIVFKDIVDSGNTFSWQEDRAATTVYIPYREQIKSATGNTGAFGSRAPTAEEAARAGMTRDEAREAQAQGDIRFSREAVPGKADLARLEADIQTLETLRRRVVRCLEAAA